MARKLLLKDAAAMALIINKMDIKSEVTKLVEDVTKGEKAQEEIGVNLVFMLIEGASKKGVIEEVFNFIGSILEKSGEEVAELPLEDLRDMLKKTADVESWTNFFKSAVQSIISK